MADTRRRIPRRARATAVTGLLATSALLGPISTTTGAAAAAGPTAVTLTSTNAKATVGALFTSATTNAHSCTASVIDSPKGNLIVTAAHCVTGTGAGMRFVPGYLNGAAPYRTWTVTAAYAPSTWLASQDPTSDMVVLKVANQTIAGHSRSIESVVGGAAIGTMPASGTDVTVSGYAAGTGGGTTTCTIPTATTTTSGVTYPTFTCGSFPEGTSGSPWLTYTNGKATLVGLIGGLQQGGCTAQTSYSSPINGTLNSLVARAGHSSGDTLPHAGSHGC